MSPEVTAWYAQENLGDGTSSGIYHNTGIGPINCPDSSPTAFSTVMNPRPTGIACCPPGYHWSPSPDIDGTWCYSPVSAKVPITIADTTSQGTQWTTHITILTTAWAAQAAPVEVYIITKPAPLTTASTSTTTTAKGTSTAASSDLPLHCQN